MSRSQASITTFTGLTSNANSYSLPDGALEIALNITLAQDNLISSRRGFGLFHTIPGGKVGSSLFEYLGTMFTLYTDGLYRLNTSSGTSTALTGETVALTTLGKSRGSAASGNYYFTSDTGVLKIESTTSSILKAGIPRGLDLFARLTTNAAGVNAGPIAPNTQVGYRVLFGRQDANNNKATGSPSEMYVATNSYATNQTTTFSTTTITVTTTLAHGLAVGETIKVADAAGTGTLPSGDYVTIAGTTGSTLKFTVTTEPTTLTALSYGTYKTAKLDATIPSGLSTQFFCQIYRTSQSATSAVVPSEDLQLVDQFNLTTAMITAGKILNPDGTTNSYYDDIDDTFRSGYLYTNPNSGDGILQANESPPFAKDVASFKGSTFYANTKSKYTQSLQLISVTGFTSGTSYLEVSTGRRYIATTTLPESENGPAKTTPSTATTWDYGTADASGYFYFYLQNASGSVSVNIAQTARSVCKAVNRDASSNVYAYYVSSAEDIPGQMLLVSKAFSVFTVVTNTDAVGELFSPSLSQTTATTATQDVFLNGLYYSKTSQPEAVPILNRTLVGDRTKPILRVVPLRDSLIIIKEDGVYRLTGDSPNSFSVTPLDTTVVCKAVNSISTLNNQIFMISNQGVVAISDTNANVVSRDIEQLFNNVIGKSYFDTQTHACSYESERLYLLSTVSPNASVADTVYVYNAVNNSWVTWDTTFDDGFVFTSDDKLYLFNSANGEITKERKNKDKLDYCDRSFSLVVGSVLSATTTELSVTGAIPEVGDVVVIDDLINRITGISTATGTPVYTFASPVTFTAARTGLLYSFIPVTIKTTPMTLGDVSRWKQFSELQIHTRNASLTSVDLQFITNASSASATTSWSPLITNTGWGYNQWGGFPWGLEEGLTQALETQSAMVVRVLVPREAQRSTWCQVRLEHNVAAEAMLLQAISWTTRPFGNRVSR